MSDKTWFDPDPERVVNINGRWMRDVEVTVPEEWVDKMRQGYMCASCFEPFPHAFPEKCSLCGYEVQEKQPHEFQTQFKGQLEGQFIPDYNVSEQAKQKMRDKGVWIP